MGYEVIPVSIAKYVMSAKEIAKFSPEQWDEKIGDAINYLVLLRALVIDEEISNVTND